MSREKVSELKPFLSLVIIVFTLFSLVFFKMEVRRLGYSVLKELRHYRSLEDTYRMHSIEYAKVMSIAKLKRLAQVKLTLQEAQNSQIIQISGHQIALKQ